MTTQDRTEATNADDDQDRPEPFATILDLIIEYGEEALLKSMAEVALLNFQNEENCDDFRVRSARLHLDLRHVIHRHFRNTPAKIKAIVSGIVFFILCLLGCFLLGAAGGRI
jgi:hypothetical protein